VQASLTRLAEVCKDSDLPAGAGNLMYPIVDAVKAYASVGEICGVMRKEFGDYTAPTAV
jgi:methylmalonyl-CoA mutase N-terminal domain/subunit